MSIATSRLELKLLTKFAGQAAQGIMSRSNGIGLTPRGIAELSYTVALEMLKCNRRVYHQYMNQASEEVVDLNLDTAFSKPQE